ncbi:MAG: DNA repair protein RecN [Desulfobacterota bacterium]|nr:DNA repair protein RecN [Thermodesulfobacteriota bacterium]MDW8001807.1 DNA repair protein RecN [Deltaproteobacteria bacterium]
MLSYLRIRDFAIIEELEVEFERGFNVITGETGAGKSIIINSIGALISPKVPSELLKRDAKYGEITAQFFIGEKDVTIRRIFAPSGRGKIFIDGELVPYGKLEKLANILVNIYSQNEYQNLLQKERYVDLLDQMLDLTEDKNMVKDLFLKLKAVESELDKLSIDAKDKEREIPLLQYQINEIESAKIKEGEEEELKERLRLLRESEKILLAVRMLIDELYEKEDSVSLKVKRAISNLKPMLKFPEIASLSTKLESLLLNIEDILFDAKNLLKKIDVDSFEVQKLEERLSRIYTIKEKYGKSLEDIENFKESAKGRLNHLLTLANRLEGKKKEKKELEERLIKATKELSKKRLEGAKRMEKLIVSELESLSMKGTEFKIDIRDKGRIDETGSDDVEFLISTNPGEPLKPLRRIASGGELSRIMLAIKKLTSKEEPKTLVFDEIDVGIGGRVAELVGKRLKELSRMHQIICITHLPQIAAYGDSHFVVEKRLLSGKTKVTIRKLERDERVFEIARMISGEQITEKSVKKAEEMLKYA